MTLIEVHKMHMVECTPCDLFVDDPPPFIIRLLYIIYPMAKKTRC